MKKKMLSLYLKLSALYYLFFMMIFFVFHAVVGILAGSFFGVQLVFLVFFFFSICAHCH